MFFNATGLDKLLDQMINVLLVLSLELPIAENLCNRFINNLESLNDSFLSV